MQDNIHVHIYVCVREMVKDSIVSNPLLHIIIDTAANMNIFVSVGVLVCVRVIFF